MRLRSVGEQVVTTGYLGPTVSFGAGGVFSAGHDLSPGQQRAGDPLRRYGEFRGAQPGPAAEGGAACPGPAIAMAGGCRLCAGPMPAAVMDPVLASGQAPVPGGFAEYHRIPGGPGLRHGPGDLPREPLPDRREVPGRWPRLPRLPRPAPRAPGPRLGPPRRREPPAHLAGDQAAGQQSPRRPGLPDTAAGQPGRLRRHVHARLQRDPARQQAPARRRPSPSAAGEASATARTPPTARPDRRPSAGRPAGRPAPRNGTITTRAIRPSRRAGPPAR